MLDVHLTPETGVQHALLVVITVLTDRLRQLDSKVRIILTGPATGNAVTYQSGLIHNTQVAPEDLALIIIDTTAKVQDKLSFRLREGVLMNTHTLGSGKLSQHIIIIQLHFVITSCTLFCIMREA